MNSKITLPELVALLAERTGLSKRQSEGFVKSLFGHISAALVNHDNVKIKGLGTFKLTEIDPRKSVDVNTGREIEIAGHYRVSFVAEKALAELINRPFELFETVELSDSVTDEMLESVDTATLTEETDWTPKPEETIIADSPATDVKSSDDTGNTDEVATEPAEPVIDITVQTPIYDLESINDTADNADDDTSTETIEPVGDNQPIYAETESITNKEKTSDLDVDKIDDVIPPSVAPTVITTDSKVISDNDKPKRKSFFGWGFVAGLLTCIVLVAVAGIIWYNNSRTEEGQVAKAEISIIPDTIDTKDSLTIASGEKDSIATSEETVEPVEEQPVVEEQTAADTKPSDSPKYDTISKTRYLTTMAKAHYGNYNLWPIIYEANDGLGHPDRIRPGTKVIIPDLAKMGIDPSNPSVIAEAKKKGVAIYARFSDNKGAK